MFPLEELLKFGVAGGLILFIIIRLFTYLEKRDVTRNEGCDSNFMRELAGIMATHTAGLKQILAEQETHAKESRENFRRVEDKVDEIRK